MTQDVASPPHAWGVAGRQVAYCRHTPTGNLVLSWRESNQAEWERQYIPDSSAPSFRMNTMSLFNELKGKGYTFVKGVDWPTQNEQAIQARNE